MTFVVAEPCIKCKYTDCVEACPVDCFHEGQNMLVINPEECINCTACVAACPTQAIFDEGDLPEKWAHYKEINAKFSEFWPNISTQKEPLSEATQYAKVEEKLELLDPNPFTPGV